MSDDPTVMNYDPEKRKGLAATYFRIKSKEVIHVNNLYKMMHEWFVEQEYCDDNEFFPETYYREKRGPNGRRMYVLWRLRKEPEYNPFYTRDMDVLIKPEHKKKRPGRTKENHRLFEEYQLQAPAKRNCRIRRKRFQKRRTG